MPWLDPGRLSVAKPWALVLAIRVPHVGRELHLGRHLRVVFREGEARFEEAALTARTRAGTANQLRQPNPGWVVVLSLGACGCVASTH